MSPRPIRNTFIPHRVSLGLVALGLAFTGILYLAPDLRRFHFANGVSLPTTFIVAGIPVVAVFWAFFGIFRRARDKGMRWCLTSLVLCASTFGLIVSAYRNDPYLAELAEEAAIAAAEAATAAEEAAEAEAAQTSAPPAPEASGATP